MLFVYVTLLSCGPSWLFTLFAVGTALLPDVLVAIWETYSVGGGVLVNKVRFRSNVYQNFNIIINVFNVKFRNTPLNRFYGRNWTAHFLCCLKHVSVSWEYQNGVNPHQPKGPPNKHHTNLAVTAMSKCILNLGQTAMSKYTRNFGGTAKPKYHDLTAAMSKCILNLSVTAMS
jgi:hypothetical protein